MGSYLLKPQTAGKPHRLRAETMIGRTQGQLRFAKDKRVSARHCRLTIAGDEVTVTDLGSSNGTFVNDAKLEPNSALSLQPGDRLTVGDQNFVLEYSAKEPLKLPALEWLFLAGAAGCMGFALLTGSPRTAGPRVPAAAETPAGDPLLLALGFAEGDFKTLAVNYARLMDAVIIDNSPKSGAVSDMEGHFTAQFRRALDEAGKLQAGDDEGKELVRLYTRKVSLLRDHMTAMTAFWKNGDLEAFKRSVEIMKDYKTTAAAVQELSDRRAGNRSAPAATVRERPAWSKPGRP